uniref:Uncharacterized protein n=1 Tax=Anopheles darlingi TaxID=43151 RepID=A0A2M4DJK4_ANODA
MSSSSALETSNQFVLVLVIGSCFCCLARVYVCVPLHHHRWTTDGLKFVELEMHVCATATTAAAMMMMMMIVDAVSCKLHFIPRPPGSFGSICIHCTALHDAHRTVPRRVCLSVCARGVIKVQHRPTPSGMFAHVACFSFRAAILQTIDGAAATAATTWFLFCSCPVRISCDY